MPSLSHVLRSNRCNCKEFANGAKVTSVRAGYRQLIEVLSIGVENAFRSSNGCGTVFKLTPTGKETVLHSFQGSDGANPTAGLVRDSAGNFYEWRQFEGWQSERLRGGSKSTRREPRPCCTVFRHRWSVSVGWFDPRRCWQSVWNDFEWRCKQSRCRVQAVTSSAAGMSGKTTQAVGLWCSTSGRVWRSAAEATMTAGEPFWLTKTQAARAYWFFAGWEPVPSMSRQRLTTGDQPLLLHSQLPKQKRIHVRKLLDLFAHWLARAVPRFGLDPQ